MSRHRSSRILSDFIVAGKRPRNQIATLSGLSNTYIRNLERGEIGNVPKKRIIALGVALNLDLSEIEDLLLAFDRASLTIDDIPVFIETAENARLSEAVLPVRDLFAYELILLSLERAPGRQVIVSDRPTVALMVEGHRSHTDRESLSRHTIYKALIEAIGRARWENFFRLLIDQPIDHYICKTCLENYLHHDLDLTERMFRFQHVVSLLNTVKTQQNFHLYLTNTCVNLSFTIKLAGQEDVHDKLSYSSRAPHELSKGKRGRLIGFLTENPTLCECFKEELAQVDKTAIDSLTDKDHQIEYLRGLLDPLAAELGGKFEQGNH